MANTGFDYKIVSAAGSAVIKNLPCQLVGYHINSAYTGTVVLHDNPAGTVGTASTPVTLGTPNQVPYSAQINATFKQGMYMVATGTPNVTIYYE